MVAVKHTIHVEPGSEIAELLDKYGDEPLLLVKGSRRFRLAPETLNVKDEDIWADYDPERLKAAVRRLSGTLPDFDAEAFKEYVYRAREEGTRPIDRP
jgi:hypothetical protein